MPFHVTCCLCGYCCLLPLLLWGQFLHSSHLNEKFWFSWFQDTFFCHYARAGCFTWHEMLFLWGSCTTAVLPMAGSIGLKTCSGWIMQGCDFPSPSHSHPFSWLLFLLCCSHGMSRYHPCLHKPYDWGLETPNGWLHQVCRWNGKENFTLNHHIFSLQLLLFLLVLLPKLCVEVVLSPLKDLMPSCDLKLH